MFNFIKFLGSKTLLKKAFFKKKQDLVQLNISVNEVVLENFYTCKFVEHYHDNIWGADYSTNTKRTNFTISKNTFALKYQEFKIINKSICTKFENKKNESIAVQIKLFQDGLTTVTPVQNKGEEKILEWLRVSLEVLKKGLSTIDHKDLILQYKLFFSKNNIRVIIYNIDIELINFNGKIIFKAFNYKNDREKFKEPLYNVELKYSYNDVFNLFIILLNEIKATENKYLKA